MSTIPVVHGTSFGLYPVVSQDYEPPHDCRICLEEFDGNTADVVGHVAGGHVAGGHVAADRVAGKVLHGFHPACITGWLGMKTICPLCKADVSNASDYAPPQPLIPTEEEPPAEDGTSLALLVAVSENNLPLVQTILDTGLVPERGRNLALTQAVADNRLRLALAIINGSERPGIDRRFALQMAARMGEDHLELLLDLLNTPLDDGTLASSEDWEMILQEVVSQNDHPTTVQALLTSPEITAPCRNNALRAAAINGHLNLVQTLLATPLEDGTLPDSIARGSAVQHALAFIDFNSDNALNVQLVIQELLRSGPISDDDRGPALRMAVQEGLMRIVQALVESGTFSQEDKNRAFMQAIRLRQPAMALYIQENVRCQQSGYCQLLTSALAKVGLAAQSALYSLANSLMIDVGLLKAQTAFTYLSHAVRNSVRREDPAPEDNFVLPPVGGHDDLV